MIENTPMEVRSRARLYTSTRQRRRLDLDEYGHGTPVYVVVESVDRSGDWGVYKERAIFETTLRSYGEVQIPYDARERLGLDVGDDVRVWIRCA